MFGHITRKSLHQTKENVDPACTSIKSVCYKCHLQLMQVLCTKVFLILAATL